MKSSSKFVAKCMIQRHSKKWNVNKEEVTQIQQKILNHLKELSDLLNSVGEVQAVFVLCVIDLYARSVLNIEKEKYLDFLYLIRNVPGRKNYICKTCHKHLQKVTITVQAVNKLDIPEEPRKLKNLSRLECVHVFWCLCNPIAIVWKADFPFNRRESFFYLLMLQTTPSLNFVGTKTCVLSYLS